MNEPQTTNLSAADRAALDAWMNAGPDAGGVPAQHRGRVDRLIRLLSLLDHAGESGDTREDTPPPDLTARTLETIARHGLARQPLRAPAGADQLARPDRTALDALMEAGLDPHGVPAEHRPRAERLSRWLGLLDHLPDERTGDLLTARTLRAIEDSRQRDRFTRQIDSMAPAGAGGGFRLRDAAAAAAIFIISAALLWPMLANARGTARQIACQANLGGAGMALADYAMDNDGDMPATRRRLGDPWWLTGKFDEDGFAQSNSAHLYTLVREKYVPIEELNCPENPHAPEHAVPGARDWANYRQTSFSYQNQYTRRTAKLGEGAVIAVVADRNPFFRPGRYLMKLKSDCNSPNHTRRGQNVLLSDGRVIWMTKPLLRGRDNIFHAGDHGLDYYTGVEAPAGENDSMLVP